MMLLAVVALIVSCTPKQESATEPGMGKTTGNEVVTDGVFIHITEGYNDPHRVLMPMKMATLMANDKDVLIYLDIHAVALVVKDAKDFTYGNFSSFQTYLNELLEMNVGIYACPTCLEVAGYTPDDLMEGIQAADKEKFFSFTKGRILTLDY